MTETERIRAFFTPELRRVISIRQIERELELPPTTLAQALSKANREIPEKHLKMVTEWLKKVGYKPKPTKK